MLKIWISALAALPLVLAAGDGKSFLPLHRMRTYVNKGQTGKFQKIAPSKENPDGKFVILPDNAGSPYRLQAYLHDAAKPDEFRRYTLKFSVSDDVTPAAQLNFTLRPKNRKYGWCGTFRPDTVRQFPLIPGLHQLTVEVDLKRQKLPDLGYVVPVIHVKNLTRGTVTVESIEAETMPSSYELPKPPPEPKGPGLPGFTEQKGALTHFRWEGEIILSKFIQMMDFTTIGLDIMQLTPANPAVAWQWPEGDTILAEYKDNAWLVRTGEKPGVYAASFSIKGRNITAAVGSEGVIFRDAENHDVFVPGGLNVVGRTLLIKNGTPELKVRQLRVIDQAMALISVEEAERRLKEASKLYSENEKYILKAWNGNKNTRQWVNSFAFHAKSLAARRQQLMRETENYLPALMSFHTVRDRYAQLVYVGVLYFFEPGGHWGNVFNKRYFELLDGQAQVQLALQFARKAESLVSRSRRVGDASFYEGVAAKDVALSVGFARSPLTHVFRRAGSPDRLYREMTIDLAAGETESAQLVLSTARRGVSGISVRCTPKSDGAPAVKMYLTDYISLMAEPNPQLPLTLGGDVEMPDVLKNYTPGGKFAIESYRNQPVQIDVTGGRNAKAGIYEYTVEVLHNDVTAASLPLKVRVRDFDLGGENIPSIGGWHYAAFSRWYGDEVGKTARRNMMLAMLAHRINPTDLYLYSPVEEDLEWAIRQGLTGVTLGRSQTESLAHPDPRIVKYTELYGSKDGENFVRIPAEVKIAPRPLKCGIDEHDLLIVPKTATAPYKYLKIHYSEIRDITEALPVQKYFRLSAGGGRQPVVMTLADGKRLFGKNFHSRRQDPAPLRTGLKDTPPMADFWLDNLRNKENLGSMIFEKGDAEPASIRLVNSCIESNYNDLMRKYRFIRSVPGGDKVKIYLYGYDESRAHLNRQILSAFRNAKKILPKEIITISTCAEPASLPEIYKYMDIHCPANGFAFTRLNRRMRERYGTKFWTYVGGGAYYPFANFERVDQPLIFARAFLWEMIGYDHIFGTLYWDYHMWRFNTPLSGSNDIDWSRWNDTHNANNGMGAIFYPGPEGEIYPSRRATALRDGADDVLAVRLAARLIAGKPEAEREALRAELQKIRDLFCSGMSTYCKDIETMESARTALYDLIEKLKK